MNAYIYQADLHCENCIEKIKGKLDSKGAKFNSIALIGKYDSDLYPTGPYPNGGGEADCPQHCGTCGLFLENPLTEDGMIYVQNEIAEFRQHGLGDKRVTDEWYEFYHIALFDVKD